MNILTPSDFIGDDTMMIGPFYFLVQAQLKSKIQHIYQNIIKGAMETKWMFTSWYDFYRHDNYIQKQEQWIIENMIQLNLIPDNQQF